MGVSMSQIMGINMPDGATRDARVGVLLFKVQSLGLGAQQVKVGIKGQNFVVEPEHGLFCAFDGSKLKNG